MNDETLKQIAEMRDKLQTEQQELRKLLAETQQQIANNDEDINACSHLLDRFCFVSRSFEDNTSNNADQF